ncbi:MAG: glycosyltransferase family 2 protein [Gammaproteobacteria bacterium]|nr:glycosyltransferase family 2 protein [Gammaproteobacteria bacterium]
MPERLPISVFVIALNEADRIGRTLASVADWADEVIVIDSGSTDGTCDIARAAGARVISHDWPGYGQQKIFGEQQCRNRWLLNLDADEVVSPALADSIRSFINGDTTGIGAAAFRWQMVHWRDPKPRRLAPSHRFVRPL